MNRLELVELNAAFVFTIVAYCGSLFFLLRKGWFLRAGIASLIIATFPMLAEREFDAAAREVGGGGAYGPAFLMLALLVPAIILIAVGIGMATVRAFKYVTRPKSYP
jgi:hypothetical protein